MPGSQKRLSGRTEAVRRINQYQRAPAQFEVLDLSNLGLTALPREITKLSGLRSLNLSGNNLTKLTSTIGMLKNLRLLDLGDNRLTDLPAQLANLTSLTKLFLNHNVTLKSLPLVICELTGLITLGVYGTSITQLPAQICRLVNLTKLIVNHNDLKNLPLEIRQLTRLSELYLHDNPALSLPVEVLGPTWPDVVLRQAVAKPAQDILDYYFRTHPPSNRRIDSPRSINLDEYFETRSAQLLLEGRVIVIGDGGAGKTSLVRALLRGELARESEETTREVVVDDWPELELTQPGTRRKHRVSVHLWDFGGQEPMHAAHPYFFTNRTLYLVVATARDVGVEDRLSYWLKMVSTHGQGARAVVAINKIDQHPMDIAQRELCASHSDCLPANPTDAFFATSCKRRLKGVAKLKKAMIRELEALDQVWTFVPSEWMTAKRNVEDRRLQNKETLTFEEWDTLADQAGVPPDERDEALRLLRDLGTVLTFPDDSQLNGLGVLNPSWVTRAIYPLLTSKELAAAGGLLELNDLSRLLQNPSGYPQHKHRWLVELMKKFELLFENEGRLLMPARLPKDAPPWAVASEWKERDVVQLEFRFSVLPESVVSKFITRWHEQAWRSESWWRHGIAVKDTRGRCAALVRAHVGDPGRITISVKGPSVARQGFIATLRAEIERLTIKLNGDFCLLLDGVHPEKYDDLLIFVHEGKDRTIKRVVDGKLREFDLVRALDLVEAVPQQKQSLINITNIGRDALGNAFGQDSRVETTSSFGGSNPNEHAKR